MRKALVLFLTMVLLLGVCSVAEAEGGHVYGASLQTLNGAFHLALKAGIEAAVADIDPEGTCIILGADKEPDLQVDQFEDLISKGCDVILVDPVDSGSINTALIAAADAGIPVVNLDSDEAPTILTRAGRCERVLTYSLDNREADLWAQDVELGPGYSAFTAHTPSGQDAARLGMGGLFNVSNALSALAVCELLGVDRAQAIPALLATRVPGRMELIGSPGQRVVGLVDYAHNKLSYQAFGASLAKEFPGWMVIALFGAPGDKAYERRVELPQDASKWADLCIYTEEDPAHEDPADICAEMAAATPEGQAFEVVVDRTEAIFRAVQVACDSNRDVVVCLLAKGDETRQHVGDEFPYMEPDGSVFSRALLACEEAARQREDAGEDHGA